MSSEVQDGKVGILTIMHTCNYGAELQAYALCSAIGALGYDCELIDYGCPTVDDREIPHPPRLRAIRHPKGYLVSWLVLEERKRKHEAFLAFTNAAMRCGSKVSCESAIAANYSTVVVGSDQTWNGPVTGWDYTFLLDDQVSDGLRKLAYAASFGDMQIGEEERGLYRRALAKFEALSTREGSGVGTIAELGIQGARHVLDPTLLLGGDEWSELAVASDVEGPYVLVYFMAEHEHTLALARRAAEELGAQLVAVNWFAVRKQPDIIFRNAASPAEFLGLVAGAEMVVTSSFHGTCFSILFEKNFRCVLKEGVERGRSRIAELVDALGLQDACLAAGEQAADLAPVDYAQPRQKLQQLRGESLAFLEAALRGDESVRVRVEGE